MKTPARSSTRRSWILGLATLLASVAICVHNHHPALYHPQWFWLTLDPTSDETSEPIVVTGRVGLADFLHVKRQDPETIVFGYDSWGTPGLRSAPVPLVRGKPASLLVEMPGLWNIEGTAGISQRLRVVYDRKVVFDQEVASRPRSSAALYFAQNPNQGPCAETLHGKLFRHDGRRLQGSVSGYFNLGERVLAWLRVARWQLLAVLLLGAGATLLGPRLRETLIRRWRRLRLALRAWHQHLVFMVSAAVCTLAFAMVLVHGSTAFIHPVSLRAVFDFQAASLLEGHLDMPHEGVQGEAFVHQGKSYTYFGIVPALLRLPFVFFDVGFGNLTDGFMIAEYFGCLLFAYLILRFAFMAAYPSSSGPRPWGVIVFLANLGLGSTLFFASSRGFVYHEAVVSSLCFALGAAYFSLRYLAAPGRRWWLGALVCGTLSVHCRPPVGLFALCLLGFTALAVLLRPLFAEAGPGGTSRLPRFWPRHLMVGLLALLGILSFNGLSYLKFRTFDGAPLRYHEQYSPERLARFEGKSFHLSNLPLNASAYLLRPGWGLRAHFPYLTTSAHKPGPGSNAKMDLAEPMLGLPFAMPGLFGLALAGLLGAFWRRRQIRPVVLVLAVSALPMSLALFAAVATSQRYTADFLPILACAAALGTVMLEAGRARWRIWGRPVAVLMTMGAILITLALTVRYQSELVWGVPESVAKDYRALGETADSLLGIPPSSGPAPTP